MIKSDCGTRTVQLTSAKAYAAGREIVVGGPPPSPEAVDPGSAFERVYNYACSGTVPDGPPVWIEGVGPARTYAIERGSQTERRQ